MRAPVLVLLLAIGCAAQLAAVPIAAEHQGMFLEPLRMPLPPMAVLATEPSCEPLAVALRFALRSHGQQIILPHARLQLRLSQCDLLLSEEIHIDPVHTAQLGEGEGLDATLIGEAHLQLQIAHSDIVVEELEFSVVRVEQQDWVAGGRYPWRAPLGGLTQQDLVERIEETLLAPHPAMRPPR